MATNFDMYADTYATVANTLGISITAVIVLILILEAWSLILKGIALWKSSQKKQLTWFIILLIVQTVGILDILYIYVFSKMKLKKNNVHTKNKIHKESKRKIKRKSKR